MIIQIKCTDYSGRLNYDSYTTIDLSEFINESDLEFFWNIYEMSSSRMVHRFISVLLIKSIKNLIKKEIKKWL